MKKKLFICGLTALAFCACSHIDEDALTDAPSGEANEIGVNIAALQSDVPITFGTVGGDSYVTRGAITEFKDKNIPDIGVFCLATGKLSSSAPSINWAQKDANATNDLMRIWQKNASAHIEPTGNGYGKVVLDNPADPHFYPNNDWYRYDFVAYHPMPDSIVYGSTYINAYFTVDGKDDVFIAKGERPVPDNEKAFSRSYYKDGNEAIPYFHFEQLMAKLDFNIKLNTPVDYDMYVDSVIIEGYPVVMCVRVASMINGSFLYEPDRQQIAQAITGNLKLYNADDTEISGQQYLLNAKEYIPVGGGLLIPPLPTTTTTKPRNLNLRIYLSDERGSSYTTEKPLTINALNEGWLKGKEYTINVTLTAPIPITSNARMGIEGGEVFTKAKEEIDVSD